MKNLLIIEDNQSLASSLKSWLGRKYNVCLATTGQAGLNLFANTQFSLVILDLGLPDMPGQEVCQHIRASGLKVPVLILTADNEVTSKVQLLDSGADDYLLKPFFIGELQARLRVLLRRYEPENQPAEMLEVADLQLDTGRRHVKRSGDRIYLRRKEFDILTYLVNNRGTVVTRAMIMENVWEPGKERWNNTVDVHIKYLRDKVDKPYQHKLIKTAYGIGYMIDDKAS